jgi:hypothetical protein
MSTSDVLPALGSEGGITARTFGQGKAADDGQATDTEESDVF